MASIPREVVFVNIEDNQINIQKLGLKSGQLFCIACTGPYKVDIEMRDIETEITIRCMGENLMSGVVDINCDLGEIGQKSVRAELYKRINGTYTFISEDSGYFEWEG